MFLALLPACSSTAPDPRALPEAKASASSYKKSIDWSAFESTALVRTTRGKNIYICSAVLIRKDLALTTAHCVENSDKNEILLGKSLSDPALQSYLVNTAKIRIHPDYHSKASFYESDLAVLPLLEPVPLTLFSAVADNKDLLLHTTESLERVGFGMRNGQNLRTWTEVFVEKTTTHVLYLHDLLSVIGDSGSAIFRRDGDELTLVALHSTLIDQGQVAAVYLPAFKTWIFEGKPASHSK